MHDRRLIESWLPIAALSEESVRERRSMSALPPTYYLHVWWARRPLVASRAAVLASLLPENADKKRFLHTVGIHGDPVSARRAMDKAKRGGYRISNPYTYDRAFGHRPDSDDRKWLLSQLGAIPDRFAVLDPTAGGGSIPFEAARLGFASFANDLNPVAVSIIRGTVEDPFRFGSSVQCEFQALAATWRSKIEERLHGFFLQADLPDRVDTTYLWARTVTCPYCEGLVPLSTDWRLAPEGTGVKLVTRQDCSGQGNKGRICSFEIVQTLSEQSEPTVARGDGICPFNDCGRVFKSGEIKRQACEGRMGEQLFAIACKKRIQTTLKSGNAGRDRWIRVYRAPLPTDDNGIQVRSHLGEKLPEWEAFDVVPSERIPAGNKTIEPRRFGMHKWCDMFSPRQLLCHGTSVEVFREMLRSDRSAGALSDVRKAAYGYLAMSLDKLVSFNSRMCRWDAGRGLVTGIFDRHNFAIKWTYAEMAPLIAGAGYDWAIRQTSKCVKELIALTRIESGEPDGLPLYEKSEFPPPPDFRHLQARR